MMQQHHSKGEAAFSLGPVKLQFLVRSEPKLALISLSEFQTGLFNGVPALLYKEEDVCLNLGMYKDCNRLLGLKLPLA